MSLPWETCRLKPVDPKQGIYERNRARDAYKRQLDLFNHRLEGWLKEYSVLDFDSKQEIRIKARRLRESCITTFRQNLQGLATTSHRREYKDVFLGQCETSFEMHDPVILDYEIKLTSEIDSIISNINLLKPDLSNKATIDWMAQLAKQKFSYEMETAEEPSFPVHKIDDPVEDEDNDKVVEENGDTRLINFNC